MPNVITGTLPLFSNKATVLFDYGATHSFISMHYAKFYNLEAGELNYKLVVSTPMENSVTCNKILHGCPISTEGKVMLVNLIVFHMVGFDVILGMDWLASYYTSIDCLKRRWYLSPQGR